MTRPESGAPTCSTCRFWASRRGDVGECRAVPPPFDRTEEAIGRGENGWALTRADEWCALHQPRVKMR